MPFTSTDQGPLESTNPALQGMGFYQKLRDSQDYGGATIVSEITADATGGKTVTIPFGVEILDVTIQCRATNAAGTVTVKKGSTAITDAIVCATDKAVTRCGSIDKAQSVLATTDTLKLYTNGAADRALVSIFCRRT
jgi:translation elongation factor EF-1alpha